MFFNVKVVTMPQYHGVAGRHVEPRCRGRCEDHDEPTDEHGSAYEAGL